MKISVFRADITPPAAHPLCAGWYPAAETIDDPLFANGVTIFPDGELPVVLCALDWAEVSNGEYELWRSRLAEAAGTLPDRVALHCLHCHGAPWPDRDAQAILDQTGRPRLIMWREWIDQALEDVCLAVNLAHQVEVTEIRAGHAEVHEVASQRRILGADAKVRATRYIECRDPAVQAEPIGLIDPFLKTVSFHSAAGKIASLHFYAVHATCRHDAAVSREFAGLARDQLATREGVPHLYFTECAGNITVGKFNSPDPAMRQAFTARLLAAMQEAGSTSRPIPLTSFAWKTHAVILPPRLAEAAPEPTDQALSRAALILAYRKRCEAGQPILITALHLGPHLSILSLPGESFIEFQLFAQALRPDSMILVPSYADCGPGYVMPDICYAQGGYEPVDSFCTPGTEPILHEAIRDVLTP